MERKNSRVSSKNISILQWNYLSLRVRSNYLSFFLAEYKYQFTLFSETWLLINNNMYILLFQVYHRDRIDVYDGVVIVSH